MERKKITLNVLIIFLSFVLLTHSESFAVKRKNSEKIRQANQCTAVGPNNATIMGFGNCYENLYYINIGIGTPPQTLGIHFDTGSDILWVPTQLASGVTPIFNTSLSSTFKNTSNKGSINYLDGSGVNGTFGTDKLSVAASLINITAQYLWVTSQKITYPIQVQGLVGMGFTSIPNFLDIAYQAGEIASPVFALQIHEQTMDSVIHYNLIPQQISKQTFFVPIYGDSYWQVQIRKIDVGGIDMSSYSSDIAVIDSGTSYFYVNYGLYSQIIGNFFYNCQIIQGTPICPCISTSKWPDFTFTFNGVQVYINRSQYIYSFGNGSCTPLFGSVPGFNQILLGDIFFRGYVITFDKINRRIGFNGNYIQPIIEIQISDLTYLLSGVMIIVIVGLIVLSLFSLQKITSAIRQLKNGYRIMQ